MNIKVQWLKQPRQVKFLGACGLDYAVTDPVRGKPKPPQAKVILFGGAAGGGKSDALIMAGLVGAIAFPGCSIAYFRRKYTELAGPGGAIMRTQQLYRSLAKWNGTQRRWTFPNGSVFEFCHAENEVDVHSYQSQQFDILLIDEASQFTRFQLRYLLTRNRATVKGVVPFCAMGSNPGGIGHGYLKREFVDVGPQEIPVDVEVEPGKFEKHLFIPSFLHDNQVLEQRDPGYRQTLENQPEEIRRALLEGDWSIFAGQYFKTFRRILHVVEEPFTPPEHWYKFASLDWGFVAPCAILWHCVEPSSGRIITYREYYGNQKTASETAEIFLEMSTYKQGEKRLPEKIHYIKASPDMWQERGLSKTRGEMAEKGESIADEFLSRDIPLEIADNRRVIGWTRVREYLKIAPDGLPFWQCTSNCTNLIRTLPELIHDPRDVEDVDDKCEDHAPEALRYGLMSRPAPGDVGSFLAGGMPGEGAANTWDFTTELDRDECSRDEYDDEQGESDGPGFYSI